MRSSEAKPCSIERLSARAFFGRLHAMTMEGFFADPIYGGNRDKVGWKLLGFPGVPSGGYR
jgi:gluconate 2-dehydrogenase gamma chain